ncbi:MlaD family protein [Xanthobacter autotrophicus]|uniref:MlaD family protein n=1 Tax=Xanthobacter TaxID=279 RepID=UPI0024AC7F8A|nr:MlaD family protein [Xanthobacter autotrophicus]MDI4664156.1 MlaD family protein [Xanthobacter autotrophicus]
METRANYTIIGAFTLAVLAAAFGFVYWFAGPQDSTARKPYEIVFDGSVAGLRQGNNVLFNGIPVGQVTGLGLVAGQPGQVLARVAINNDVPVLSDAKAGLESQGLTGIVVVSIRGGQPGAPPLPLGPNGVPRISADGGAGMAGLLASAQGVARRIEVVLDAINPQDIKNIIANIDTFSKAVASKSEDVASLIEQSNALVKQLNGVAEKVERVVVNLQKATEDKDGLLMQATDAASSVRKLADNLDQRTALLTDQISRFTGPGLKQYEALATDGRRTLNEIDRVLKNIERNPQQFIFGGGNSIPKYGR